MPPRSPIIAFLAASPFELLDLTGPAAVFAYPTLKDKPYYSFRILSTASGDTVKSMGGLSIGDTCRFSEYAGPIDTLIVVGGPQWSGQNRPYVVTSKPAMGRFPGLRCCTLPFAFWASLISEILRWKPISSSKFEKNLVYMAVVAFSQGLP